MRLTCLRHGVGYPAPLQAHILQLSAIAGAWFILGVCEHCNLLACLPAGDIVLVVPLQAPYSLF